MRLIITHHAVEQFIERHARDLTFKQARQFLIQNAPGAAPLKQKTLRGDQQWQMEDPKCVLVMKQDRKIKAHVCVTVLPEAEGLDEISDEELYRIMEEGEPDSSQIDSLIEAAEAEKVHLITPSVSLEAEEQRIEKEHPQVFIEESLKIEKDVVETQV